MPERIYDVAIIGGGPAGSTAATLLARAGRRVIVCEREKFPRFHIGESLLPASMNVFSRLGVREKLDRTFMPKYGGEIVAACGTRGTKFYFKDGFRSQRDRAYQVTRSEFDKLLLDHSRENGAEVSEETTVEQIEFSNDGVALQWRDMRSSSSGTIHSRYLLDCSGRQTILGNFFKLKKMYDHLQKFSVFAHYENVDRPSGIDGTLIRMVRGLDRWFWMIPLTATRMSIGVVMDTATFRAMKLSPEEALDSCIDEQPMMLERMKNAERVSPVYSAGDYSYRNAKLFGDRWLLAGDAAGFIDPVFSSGVFLAIMSAEKAADALNDILRDEALKPRLFRNYSRRVNRVMDMYLTFVNSWYRGKEFVEVFLNPTEMLQIAAAVNAVLAGNEGASFPVKWRMWLFYFFVRAQRFLAFSPRLSLRPQKLNAAPPRLSLETRIVR
ncbi:MAG TPA: NAD(P)/FAD-dependent oxidoreductase [Chthoniobacterales bacterium]